MDIKKPKVGKKHNRLVEIVKVYNGEIRVIRIDGVRFAVANNKHGTEGVEKMSFVDELREAEALKTAEHAKKVAEELRPVLIKSAENGYTGHNLPLDQREDRHILRKQPFLEALEKELDGCKVSLEKTEHTDILFKTKYYKPFININWAIEEEAE